MDTVWCVSCDHQLRNLPLDLQTRNLQPLLGSISTGTHEGLLQTAIHALKYESVSDVIPALGDRLLAALAEQNWSFDMLIPVPIHTLRLKQRGYNQSQVVGSYMAQFMVQPVVSTALERVRNTPSQVGLSHQERITNLSGAFHADSSAVSAATILLLDDVMTTGSTLRECAHALLEAGALAVLSLTISAARL